MSNVTDAPYVFDKGDTAFVFANSALVMIMTPGLALFYGGMVRQKNAVATIMQSFISLVLISLQWWFWGYSLAFSEGGKFYGDLNYILLLFFKTNMLTEPHPNAPTVPGIVYMIYQCMFATVTPALITGAAAERLRFRTYLVFLFCWSTLVYCPIAHWAWHPNGWMYKLGVLDFAGGTVVHISSGMSALVLSMFVGSRRGYWTIVKWVYNKIKEKYTGEKQETDEDSKDLKPSQKIAAHNVPMVVIGTALLWFGWFGFNGGSAIVSSAWAANAFVVTNLAASSGALTWMILEWLVKWKPTLVGACTGAVVGLVAITPAAGYVYPIIGVLCGFLAAFICFWATKLKGLFMDDSLDAFSCHGIGGIVGCIFTGIFAAKEIPWDGAGVVIPGGWWNRHWKQLGFQIASVCATSLYSMGITAGILFILWKFPLFGWRVTQYEERVGLDYSQHGEDSYVFDIDQETRDKLFDEEDDKDDIVSVAIRFIKKKRGGKSSGNNDDRELQNAPAQPTLINADTGEPTTPTTPITPVQV